MLVSGARENPKYPRQRRRIPHDVHKPVDVRDQRRRAAGPPVPGQNDRGPRRLPPSDRRPGPVPNARAPDPGWRIRMDRNAAMASSKSASRCSSPTSGSWDHRLAAKPRRNRTSVWSWVVWGQVAAGSARRLVKTVTFDQDPRGIDARVRGQVRPPR